MKTLSIIDAYDIRRARFLDHRRRDVIAKQYGITESVVREICAGRAFPHAPWPTGTGPRKEAHS